MKTAVGKYRVVRALDDEDDGTLSNLDGESPQTQRAAGQSYLRTGEPIADGGDGLLDLFRKSDDIDPGTIRRLDKLHDSGDLSDNDIDALVRAYESNKIDGDDLRRVSKLLDASNEEYLYDDAVSVNELLQLTEKADLSKTKFVVEDPDGDTIWLEKGDSDTGLVKIRQKHLQDFIDKYDTIEDEEDMLELMYKSIKNPDRTEPNPGGGTRYFYQYEGEELRTATGDNGYILSSHPDPDD